MATILEVGAHGETWVSEHSGRSATSEVRTGRRPPTPTNPGGEIVFSDAQKGIWEHENADYAEERKHLQVGAERPIPNVTMPTGPITLTAEDWADVQAVRAFMDEKRRADQEEADRQEADARARYQEWLDKGQPGAQVVAPPPEPPAPAIDEGELAAFREWQAAQHQGAETARGDHEGEPDPDQGEQPPPAG